MGEVKINTEEVEGLIGSLRSSHDALNLEEKNLDLVSGLCSNADGLTSFKNVLFDIKRILSYYRLLLSMDISLVEKSKKEMEQLDHQIESSINRK